MSSPSPPRSLSRVPSKAMPPPPPSMKRTGSWVASFDESSSLLLTRLNSVELFMAPEEKPEKIAEGEATPPISPEKATPLVAELPCTLKRKRLEFEEEEEEQAERPWKRPRTEEAREETAQPMEVTNEAAAPAATTTTTKEIAAPTKWILMKVIRWPLLCLDHKRKEEERALALKLWSRGRNPVGEFYDAVNTKYRQFDAEEKTEEQARQERLDEEKRALGLDSHPAATPPEDGMCYFDLLPDEIMIHIFGFLNESNILTASEVCYQWHKLSKDPHVAQRVFTYVRLLPKGTDYVRSYNLTFSVLARKQTFTEEGEDPNNNIEAQWEAIGEVEYSSVTEDFSARWWKWQIVFRNDNNPRDFNFSLNKYVSGNAARRPSDGRLWRWGCVLRRDTNEVELRLHLNVSLLSAIVHNAHTTPHTEACPHVDTADAALFDPTKHTFTDVEDSKLFFELFRALPLVHYKDLEANQVLPRTTAVPPPDAAGAGLPRQPPRLRAVRLYDYQRESLHYMLGIERNVDCKVRYECDVLETWDGGAGRGVRPIVVDVETKTLYASPAPKRPPIEWRAEGGILADEMGLGKTITVLSLVLSNPAPPPPGGQDAGIVGVWKDDVHLYTRATLILCPSHLVRQWADEIGKFVEDARVVTLTVFGDLKVSTYADMAEADVVVVSYQFLKNVNYLSHSKKKPCFKPAYARERIALVESAARRLRRDAGDNPAKFFSRKKTPILEHFAWRRMVVDEGHEAVADDFVATTLAQYAADYRWYVTGTPFPRSRHSLQAAVDFVKATAGPQPLRVSEPQRLIDKQLARSVVQSIYIRHTKASVAAEYRPPGLVEELVLIAQHPVEKLMYDLARRDGDTRRLRMLCCSLQISNHDTAVLGVHQRTLLGVRTTMLETLRKRISDADTEITTLCTMRRGHQDRITAADPTQRWVRANAEREIEKIDTRIRAIESSKAQIREELKLWEALDSNEPDVSCAICPRPPPPVVLPAFVIGAAAPSPPPLPPPCEHLTLDQLVLRYGSKMGHLIFYLRKLCSETDQQIIVFSQWDRMLARVGETLEENGISNVFCKGNVFRRNKAIALFKKQTAGVRVIMLSLENAASGTNLTEANHIVMIDPVGRSRKEARAIEAQAIGRANRLGQTRKIKVVRFIMKDTIEHELYLRNYAEESSSGVQTANNASITNTTGTTTTTTTPTETA